MSAKPTIKQAQEFTREHDCHFICPQCGGAFWGTRYLGTDREQGYCKTHDCDFKWPRTEDGEHFYITEKVNDVCSRLTPEQKAANQRFTKKEAQEIIRRFHIAVTDYFRDGEPFRLREKVFEVGPLVKDAMDILFSELTPEQEAGRRG